MPSRAADQVDRDRRIATPLTATAMGCIGNSDGNSIMEAIPGSKTACQEPRTNAMIN